MNRRVTKLSVVHYAVILSMAANSLRPSDVARDLCYHRNTVIYYCDQILALTGLDPRTFYDECKLLDVVKEAQKNGEG